MALHDLGSIISDLTGENIVTKLGDIAQAISAGGGSSGGGGSGVTIVQTTGTSTSSVMSQGAVTNSINALKNLINAMGGGNGIQAFQGTIDESYSYDNYPITPCDEYALVRLNPVGRYTGDFAIYDHGLESVYWNGSVNPPDFNGFSLYRDKIRFWDIDRSLLLVIPLNGFTYISCFLEGTKVLTMDGEKNIEDVTTKDRVGYWSVRNQKLQYDQVIIPLETGACTEYEAYYFSDGTVLKIFGDDRIYDYDLDRDKSTREWKPGDRALKNDGSVVTFIGKQVVTLDTPARRFHLITRSGCKSADGIRVGHDKGEIWRYLQRPEYSQYIPNDEKLVENFKMYHRRYLAVKNYYFSPEYYDAVRDDIMQMRELSKQIADHKQFLTDTDYQVVKYMDGAMTEEEYLPIQAARADARDAINRLEVQLAAEQAALDTKRKALKQSFIDGYILR